MSRNRLPFLVLAFAVVLQAGCRSTVPRGSSPAGGGENERPYLVERVDEVAIVQIYADGFDRLSLRDKRLAWHLYQAAIAGRDIFIAQKCAEGPEIRDLIEEIIVHSSEVEPGALAEIRRYAKLFWVNNSPYNAITSRKNVLRLDRERLVRAAEAAGRSGAILPARDGETARELVDRLAPMLFDPDHKPMATAKNPEGGEDILSASAVTFYGEGVTMEALEGFEEEYELNSTVVIGADGRPEERVWRAGDPERGIPPGLYAREIEAIIVHLEKAREFAPAPTAKALDALIRSYRSGYVEDLRAYDIAWVADDASVVDTVNGFVEVYADPRGKKGAWEGIVSYEDPEKAHLIKSISENAQWFEDHMPFEERFRKPEVRGISARSIDVIVETGDSGPVSPVGINLPNDQNVREQYGSKSVNLANVVDAYHRSRPEGTLEEFCLDEAEVARARRWGPHLRDLLTNMHEVIGHASGQQAPDRQGDPADWIKENYSALEEARADLIALYFMADPKLKELGLLDDPAEAALAAYERYTRNGGLLQLRRIPEGDQIEEDHMRNRQLVVHWIMENSDAIEKVTRDGRTYLRVTDANAWRDAAGRLLAVVQEVKSTGDYDGAKVLFDTCGIKFDPGLRDEVVGRFEDLNVPSYRGFIMPRLSAITGEGGEILDVVISYPLSLEEQMLEWSGRRGEK